MSVEGFPDGITVEIIDFASWMGYHSISLGSRGIVTMSYTDPLDGDIVYVYFEETKEELGLYAKRLMPVETGPMLFDVVRM